MSELLATYGQNYFMALLTTWRLTAISFTLAMVFAIIITVARVCPFKPLRVLGDFYVQVFRNIPGAVALLIVVYALPHLGLVLDYEPCVIVTTTVIVTAFGSENFMSGINTIDVGQIEAARSLGLTFVQMLRHVIIPQALRSSILPMTNLLIGTLLTTALGSQVPLSPQELTGVVTYINTRASSGVITFIFPAIAYVLTSVLIGFAGNALDKKVRVQR